MKLYGEILVFFLLFITNARILFVKKAKRDSLAYLSPVNVILSVFLIFAWGFEPLVSYAFLVSILVLLSNFHALFRYSEHLFVDHYSISMKIWSFLTMFLSIIGIVASIVFAPVEFKNSDLKINEKIIQYSGSMKSGFSQKRFFQKANAKITEFSPNSRIKNPKNVILLLTDKRGDSESYRPYMQLLASEGFTVCSGDFFTDDCRYLHNLGDSKLFRREIMTYKSISDQNKFLSEREFYTYNISQEINSMINLLDEIFENECTYFLVTDVMTTTAANDFIKSNSSKISGHFALESLQNDKSYQTPGYGFIAQTDIIAAKILNTKRDSDGFFTRFAVKKTIEEIYK